MIQEIPVFPQITYSTAQGKTATRKWVLTECEDVDAFCRQVCASYWPGDYNTVPIAVQVGAADEKMMHVHTTDVENIRPDYNLTMVIAQYQFLHISDCWSARFPKPAHRQGTVLTMRVRGSGQFIQISPAGLLSKQGATFIPGFACDPTTNSRILIPITEYHISCDRMKAADVENAMVFRHWREREGTVNADVFLGEPVGALLFETWDMEHSFAPDVDNPARFKLTAVLRARQIPGVDAEGNRIGWNHDYRFMDETNYGWMPIRVRGTLPNDLEMRYPADWFCNMFCDTAGGTPCQTESCGGGCTGGEGSDSDLPSSGGGI